MRINISRLFGALGVVYAVFFLIMTPTKEIGLQLIDSLVIITLSGLLIASQRKPEPVDADNQITRP